MKRLLAGLILSLPILVRGGEGRKGFVPNDFDWFISFIVPYNSIKGDFDGNTFYSGSGTFGGNFTLLVPEIDTGFGGGIGFGAKNRLTENVALGGEISFQQSSHDARWANLSRRVTLTNFNFDVKVYGRAWEKAQPFFLIGYGFPGVEVKDGYLSAQGTKDAVYQGVSFNLGGGLLYYMNNHWSFQAGAVYRMMSFGSVDFGQETDLNQDLDSATVSLELNVAYRFAGYRRRVR